MTGSLTKRKSGSKLVPPILILLVIFILSTATTASAGNLIEVTGKDGAPMVLIPDGDFLMGSPQGEGAINEHPQHSVYLSAYCIDKYEVTNAQFQNFVNATGYVTESEKGIGGYVFDKQSKAWSWNINASWKDPNGDGRGISKKMNHPVVQVSWSDATAYAKHYGKRLPTEAEWEKAARAGSTTKYYVSESVRNLSYAWYSANSNWQTKPVGGQQIIIQKEEYVSGPSDPFYRKILREYTVSAKPNAFGLYDVYGNVWEWCSDGYDANYYSNSPTKNPTGSFDSSERVTRGGGWNSPADACRPAFRCGMSQTFRVDTTGFRCTSSP